MYCIRKINKVEVRYYVKSFMINLGDYYQEKKVIMWFFNFLKIYIFYLLKYVLMQLVIEKLIFYKILCVCCICIDEVSILKLFYTVLVLNIFFFNLYCLCRVLWR